MCAHIDDAVAEGEAVSKGGASVKCDFLRDSKINESERERERAGGEEVAFANITTAPRPRTRFSSPPPRYVCRGVQEGERERDPLGAS